MADRMWRAVSLVSVLVLGSAWILTAVTPDTEPQFPTQEGFNISQFMGRWFELAVVSTCPHYLQRKRGNPVIVALEMQHNISGGSFTLTSTSFRRGSCEQTVTDYSLTPTPGRFFHHVARFGADVDTFVVHSDFTGSAMILQQGTEQPAGIQTITAKLYSRALSVEPGAVDIFKTLIKERGMKDEDVIMNKSKGECLPGDPQTLDVSDQAQASEGKQCRLTLQNKDETSREMTEQEDHHPGNLQIYWQDFTPNAL